MRIAICTPHYADVSAYYARSLAGLVGWTLRSEIQFNGARVVPHIEIFMRRSTILARCRNRLAQDAADWNADYLLWIDGDHAFPADGLVRLLSHNHPVIGANYVRRVRPTLPTAVGLDGQLLWTSEEKARAGAVEPVAHLGLGFCLVDMRIVRALQQPDATGRRLPLSDISLSGGGLDAVAEDVHFFRRVRSLGVEPQVDHALSWAIGHVHHEVLTHADAVADTLSAPKQTMEAAE